VFAIGSIKASALAMPILPVSRYAIVNATVKCSAAKVAVFARLNRTGMRILFSGVL